ncbi:BolA family protein [Umboniibacter marinipuniceus]|uniref:BolA protein n=1 Tax=Umboniibacter marinipuniceus TaxID=569599 RepID=A0A3M0AFT9_9GAMM|nr:BolA/IbaG family iron-sulfur metabolism protein [Umboniibacter marinipuniceus]RMA81355.1 BolA protein [Umboniibacter marinipuniceus]
MGPMQQNIITKLQTAFNCHHLEVENEGDKHSAGAAAEMHFKVTLVSTEFEGKMKVARHRAIYSVLSEELAGQVHALALYTYTPAEWEQQGVSPETPDCANKH